MAKEIWVYAEQNNGKIADVTAELLSKARALAPQMGDYTVAAFVTGKDNKKAEEKLGHMGAQKVYSLTHEKLEPYRADTYAHAITTLIQEKEPEYVFFGATAIGSELAPTVAGLLKTGLAAHCIDLRYKGERLNCMVPAFGGKVVSEIYIPTSRPVMASIRPGILEANPTEPCQAQIIPCNTEHLDHYTSGEEYLGFEENEKTDHDIETAEIIISAGRGAASEKAWETLQAISEKLGGTIAYSRSFIDTGHVNDENSMIGTSGKSIRPNLLINAGISGATQYVCGINKSKTIISINKNPKAPIFGYSDYGVAADVDDILPAVLERL